MSERVNLMVSERLYKSNTTAGALSEMFGIIDLLDIENEILRKQLGMASAPNEEEKWSLTKLLMQITRTKDQP